MTEFGPPERTDVPLAMKSAMFSFPTFKTVEGFQAWRADPALWLPLAADIARAHALPRAGLLALMMLHRPSDPIRHIAIEGWREKAETLDDLARLLWPVG